MINRKDKQTIKTTPVDYDPFSGSSVEKLAPSTEAQKEIWLSVQMGDEANCAYNESLSITLTGVFNQEAIELTFECLINRHDALRATFVPDGSSLCISGSVTSDVTFVDLSKFDEPDRLNRLDEMKIQVVKEPFNLETGPLYKICIIRLSMDRHVIIFTAHHIIFDGFSSGVLLREMAAIYSSLCRDQHDGFEEAYQFSEFALQQTEHFDSTEYLEVERYWLNEFSADITTLDLPIDKQRPAFRTFNSHRIDLEINASAVKVLKKVGSREGCSFFVTLFAAFSLFLHKLSNQKSFAIGVPAAGQSITGKDDLIGHCLYLLPIRLDIDIELSFAEFLKKVKRGVLDAFDHQEYTFGSLIRKLDLPRDSSRIPLVPVLFNLDEEIDTKDFIFHGLEASVETNPRYFENFEIFINAVESERGLKLECQYNTDLFEAETIRTRLLEFKTLVECIGSNTEEKPIHSLSILSDDEKQMLLSTWNATEASYPLDQCLHEVIADQCRRSADKTAIVFEDQSLTYRDLNERSNQLAAFLQKQGVGPDVLVGIYVNRSLEMVVGVLGILKAGGAYVPLDPNYPEERIDYMLSNAGVKTILSQTGLSGRLPVQPDMTTIICLDTEWEKISAESTKAVISGTRPDHLAYVIYTSGSTGKPKGVMVPHGAVVNFLFSMQKTPGLQENDRLLAVTTLSFDIHVLEIYLPLITGAMVCVLSMEKAVDGEQILSAIETNKITVMQATPTTWRLMLAAGWQGTPDLKVLCGGEAFPRDLARSLIPRAESVWNMYGPTETTVWSTCSHLVDPDEPMRIGKPIANTLIYILDDYLQPVPIGVDGELYIGGDGVVRGYLNRENLTRECFVADPFSDKAGARMYKTGDLVRYHSDGSLEYLNRIDSQVKIRGFRIELGEIETVLSEHPQVDKAVAIVREDQPGDVRLIAYIVAAGDRTPDTLTLKEFLRTKLPEYMVPQHLNAVDSFPLTPAGKIDRKNLPQIDMGQTASRSFVAPRNELESELAEIWQAVLGVPAVSIHDNFFDLGGHSLLGVQLFNRIEKITGKKLPLAQLFRSPTISQLADIIGGNDLEPEWSSIVPIRPEGSKPPLFLVHGAGGNVLFYRHLSNRLNPDWPVYGIQSQGLDGKEELLTSVEEMALLYVKEIQSFQPRGPYFLAGYCLGGQVAYEMARQFEAEGEKVAFVGLMDTQRQWSDDKFSTRVIQEYQRIAFHLKNFAMADLSGKILFIKEKFLESMRRIYKRLLVSISSIAFSLKIRRERPLTLMENVNDLAAARYVAPSYDGKITLFRPLKNYSSYDDPMMGWGGGLVKDIDVQELSMYPAGMLYEPFVPELAEKLERCLENALSEASNNK